MFKPRLESSNNIGRIVNRQSRLGDVTNIVLIRNAQLFHLFRRFDQCDIGGIQLTQRANHFWMASMANQQHVATKALVPHGLFVHL